MSNKLLHTTPTIECTEHWAGFRANDLSTCHVKMVRSKWSSSVRYARISVYFECIVIFAAIGWYLIFNSALWWKISAKIWRSISSKTNPEIYFHILSSVSFVYLALLYKFLDICTHQCIRIRCIASTKSSFNFGSSWIVSFKNNHLHFA
jgi:hypothetical protein